MDKLRKISVRPSDSNPGLPDGRPRCKPDNHAHYLWWSFHPIPLFEQIQWNQIFGRIPSKWAWWSGSHLGLPSGSPGFESDRRTKIFYPLTSGLLSFKKPETVLWTIAKHYYYYYPVYPFQLELGLDLFIPWAAMCLIGKLISVFSDVGFKDKENKEVVYFTSHVQFVCFSLTPAFLSKCA